MLLIDREKKEYIEIIEKMADSRAYRTAYCELDFSAFYLYYFASKKSISYLWIKEFHKEIIRNLTENKNFLCIWFRWSAKSTIMTNIYIIWLILYKKRKYILMLSFKLESAEEKVLNVWNILRTPNNITKDYWIRLEQDKSEKAKKENRMSEFTTKDNVKVVAVSLENLTRWRQRLDFETWESLRPDLIIWDDLDIKEEVLGWPVLEKRYRHLISSAFSSTNWKIIISWNVVGLWWLNTMLRDDIATKSKSWIYQQIDLIKNGEIVWKEKFKETEEEAKKALEEYKKHTWDENIENPFKSMQNIRLEPTFSSDYLNIWVYNIWDPVFNTERLKQIIPITPLRKFNISIWETKATFEIFSKDFEMEIFNFCYCGADIWWWDGGDYTDVTLLDQNGKLFARLTNNQLNYKWLLHFFIILYENFRISFFKNSLWVENNFLWKAFFDELEDLRRSSDTARALQKLVYIGRVKDWKKITRSTKIWWNTNNNTKEALKTWLQEAILHNELLLDEKNKKEFLAWEKQEKNGRIIYSNNPVMSEHDDSVISYWIAYQMYLQYNKNYERQSN